MLFSFFTYERNEPANERVVHSSTKHINKILHFVDNLHSFSNLIRLGNHLDNWYDPNPPKPIACNFRMTQKCFSLNLHYIEVQLHNACAYGYGPYYIYGTFNLYMQLYTSALHAMNHKFQIANEKNNNNMKRI